MERRERQGVEECRGNEVDARRVNVDESSKSKYWLFSRHRDVSQSFSIYPL